MIADPWPHAPPHHFTPCGVYLLTAGTLHKARLFEGPRKLDLFRATAFGLIADYHLALHAGAFLANHYHLVVGFEKATVPHRVFLRHLHRELALRLNEVTPLRAGKSSISSGTAN